MCIIKDGDENKNEKNRSLTQFVCVPHHRIIRADKYKQLYTIHTQLRYACHAMPVTESLSLKI